MKWAEALNSQMSLIYGKILSAETMLAQGDRENAASVLSGCMSLALPDRLYMPFAENLFAPDSSSLSSLLDGLSGRCCPARADLDKIGELARTLEAGKASILNGMFPSIPYSLTAREFETARLAAHGLRNREIGQRMGLSENVVKQYLHSAFGKMNVRNRTALAAALDKMNKTDTARDGI